MGGWGRQAKTARCWGQLWGNLLLVSCCEKCHLSWQAGCPKSVAQMGARGPNGEKETP